ncbi:MAG: AarF/ABC1/UbiB kinase family protein [Microscillaceae bacterium]|jgi:ubiquinone biosynthesis protein|nr:AarF/ABC1/UbiB kinase family protein [Microscillaceae bacterium]
MLFQNTVQNLNRIREVISVLIKYGFEDVVANTSLRRLIPPRTQKSWQRNNLPVLSYSRWERMRMVVEELGSTFIKLAQLLSNRPDLIPEPLIIEFEKLQSEVPPIDFEIIQKNIEKELGKPIQEIFAYFDKKPLGSASIGQVHRAQLLSGEDVVVKVQRPDAKRQVNTDLAILREFVRLTENYFKRIGILNPLAVVDTFEKSMHEELDYTNEAKNMDQFRKLYANNYNFYVPMPYRELTTHTVLTIEYVSGCKITDLAQLEAWGLDSRRIVERGMNIYLSQIFEKGVFHADPHPGNILVRPNGTLVLIDFGMVGKLLKHEKYAFAGVFVGLANQDSRAMALNLRRLAVESDIDNMQVFENDVDALIENFVTFNVDDESGISEVTAELQKIIYKYKLQVPGTIFLILRALAILENIGKILHPQFQTLEFIRPYGLKLIAEQFSFKNQRNELTYTFTQLLTLLYIFPIEVKNILRQLRNGEITINYTLKKFEEIPRHINIIGNKLVLTLLICSLMITSAMMMQSPLAASASRLFGLPYWSALGFAAAGFLGIWLFLYTIFRRR